MRSFVPVLLIAACLPVCGSAQDMMDTKTLAARVYAARGLVGLRDHRETIEYTTPDAKGSYTYIQAGRAWRVQYDEGGFHSQRGVNGSFSWFENENGIVEAGQGFMGTGPDTGTPTPPPFGTVLRVSSPVDAWLVSSLDASGFGRKMYVDPQTFFPMRVELITVNGTVTTTYDDYRNESGEILPHHWKVDDRVSRVVADYRITRFETGHIDPSEVDWPKVNRELVEFPEGEQQVQLPVNFVGTRMYVRVVIGNRGLDFVLDTGSSGIVIDRDVADQLGLKTYDERSVVVAARTSRGRAIVPEMRVGNLAMHNVTVQTIPASGFEFATGIRPVGLLGFDFFATIGLMIDYQHKTVTACRAKDFVPEEGSDVLEARLLTAQPMVTVRINDITSPRFVIDTGSPGNALLFDQFFRTHPDEVKYFTARGKSDAQGIGGRFERETYRVHDLQLGTVVFHDYTVDRVLSQSSYNFGVDGVIGADFLSYFRVGLDYHNWKIYLKRNDRR